MKGIICALEGAAADEGLLDGVGERRVEAVD